MTELFKPTALAISSDIQVNIGALRLLASHQILDTASLSLDLLDLTGLGKVDLGSGVLTVAGNSAVDVFNGDISGAGGELDKLGSNTLDLRGNNTYTAGTLVKGGKLLINGSQSASDVYIYSGATVGGGGTTGALFGKGGTVSPGNSPGRLTATKSSSFDSATTLMIEINGQNAGTDYDQLSLTGNLALNNSHLQISMGFAGAIGNRFMIVKHQSGSTPSPFQNLPEGAILTVNNGATLRITYVGGDGNDVELIQLSLPVAPQFGGVSQLANGSIELKGKGAPGVSYTVEANADLRTTQWVTLGSITANNLGALAFIDSKATNYTERFYRFIAP